MLRYELTDGTVVEIAYDLTHAAMYVRDLFLRADGRVLDGVLVSTHAEITAAYRAWRTA